MDSTIILSDLFILVLLFRSVFYPTTNIVYFRVIRAIKSSNPLKSAVNRPISRVNELLHLAAIHQCVGDCKLVDILQLIAKADASSYGRNLNIGECLEAVE